MTILRLTDLDLAGKRVLIRAGPQRAGEADGKVTSDQRILAARFPRCGSRWNRGAAVMVTSHLGPAQGRHLERGRLAGARRRSAWPNTWDARCRSCKRLDLDGVEGGARRDSCCSRTAA
jgi:hypothetical protein